MPSTDFNKMIALLRQEVKPALGCTEPVAAAIATARSCEELRTAGYEPERIEVLVSANILKNGMGVGIPGTGMVGLPIAAALAAVCGNSSYGLEVLKALDGKAVGKAREMLEAGKVKVGLSDTPENLYVKVSAISAGHKSEAVVSGSHDTITYVAFDGQETTPAAGKSGHAAEGCPDNPGSDTAKHITVKEIYDFALTVPLEDIGFIMDSVTLNMALVDEGLKHRYGLQVGRTLLQDDNRTVYGDSILTHAMACTAAASDARMAGCTLPAMSNSGSGNQGITATVPVIVVAEKTGATREQLLRALTLSHLIAIHIKGHLGKLSALCGCVIASTGSSCGIVYLRGGGYEQICSAIKNMVGNITGMVCDGAKEGCALKVASGVACSMQSAVLALDGICISPSNGIIEKDIEKTIGNLGQIGSVGMRNTDRMILNIMVCK